MVKFEEREKGFEAKFLHDQNIEFKIRSKRNHLLGQWAGEIIKSENMEKYIKEVRSSALEKPGDDDIIDKIYNDFQNNSVALEKKDIVNKINEFDTIARSDIKKI